MARLILILALLIGSVQGAVKFVGVHQYRTDALLDSYRKNGDPDSFAAALTNSYVDDGYFLAGVSREIVGIDTLFEISEVRRFRFSDLRLSGLADSISAPLLTIFKPSQPLTKKVLDSLTHTLIRLEADRGFPFAQAEIKNLTVVGSQIAADFLLVTGPWVDIGQIEFPGLRITRPEPLRKRIALIQGHAYSEGDLVSTEKTLSQLRHCYPAGVPVLSYESRTRTVDISIPMRDERNLAFDGFAYISPDNSIAGQVNTSLINPFGHGEEFNFLWSRQNQLSHRLAFSALFPYIADYAVDLRASLTQEDRDSSFVGTAATLGGAYHFGSDWNLSAGFQWDKVTPQENRISPAARLLSVDLGTQFDDRDDIRQTHRGALVSQRFVSSYRKSFDLGGGVTTGYSTRLDGDARLWLPLSRDLVIYQRARYFQITSDFAPIPVDQLTPIGGVETIRGYRDNSFLARLGALGTAELRWYASGNLMLHLFTDNGYIKTIGSDRRLTGFGLGLIIGTTAGAFRFDLSLGEEKQISRMLVHLGLEGKL